MILKPTPEMPEQAHRKRMAVRISISSQANSPISEAITAPNVNTEFEIRNNQLDKPQGMSVCSLSLLSLSKAIVVTSITWQHVILSSQGCKSSSFKGTSSSYKLQSSQK